MRLLDNPVGSGGLILAAVFRSQYRQLAPFTGNLIISDNNDIFTRLRRCRFRFCCISRRRCFLCLVQLCCMDCHAEVKESGIFFTRSIRILIPAAFNINLSVLLRTHANFKCVVRFTYPPLASGECNLQVLTRQQTVRRTHRRMLVPVHLSVIGPLLGSRSQSNLPPVDRQLARIRCHDELLGHRLAIFIHNRCRIAIQCIGIFTCVCFSNPVRADSADVVCIACYLNLDPALLIHLLRFAIIGVCLKAGNGMALSVICHCLVFAVQRDRIPRLLIQR